MTAALFALSFALAAPLPPWTETVGLEGANPQALHVLGKDAPAGLVLVKGSGGITLHPSGPGKLQLEIYLLTLKHGPKDGVTVNLILQTGAASRVMLPGTPQSWRLRGEPLFALGRPLTTTVRLGHGPHTIKLQPAEKRALGLAVRARILPITEEDAPEPGLALEAIPAPPEPEPAPPVPGDPNKLWDASGSRSQAPSTAVTQAIPMPRTDPPTPPSGPALPQPEDAADADAADSHIADSDPADADAADADPADADPPETEPADTVPADTGPADTGPADTGPADTGPGDSTSPDATEPAPEDDLPLGAGFRAVGTYPSLVIEGPRGEETFMWVPADDGLELDAVGPGVLRLDLHAHRDRSVPATLEPVIIALLINDVLVETISLPQPPSPNYRPQGQSFEVGWRTELAVPVDPGVHEILLTLSENAARGISVRPRFDKEARLEAPTLSAERPPSLAQQAAPMDTPPWRGEGAVLAGLWLPLAIPSPGLAVSASARLGFPLEAVDLAVGVQVSFLYAAYASTYKDPRILGGRDSVSLSLAQIPALLDVRYRAHLPWDLALSVAAGVGPMLMMGQRSAAAVSEPWATEVGGAASGTAGLEIPLGPGALDIQAQLLMQLSPGFTLGGINNVNGTGASILVGYRLQSALGGDGQR